MLDSTAQLRAPREVQILYVGGKLQLRHRTRRNIDLHASEQKQKQSHFKRNRVYFYVYHPRKHGGGDEEIIKSVTRGVYYVEEEPWPDVSIDELAS